MFWNRPKPVVGTREPTRHEYICFAAGVIVGYLNNDQPIQQALNILIPRSLPDDDAVAEAINWASQAIAGAALREN